MQLAEFFVSLGVKGSEKAVGSIQAVSEGMSKLWNSSTEAKVAIVGAFYALEQLFAQSNRNATALSQYGTLTGMSTQKVQEYNAAIQLSTGIQRDLNTTLATFQDLQNKINDIRFNKGGIVGHLQLMFSALGMKPPDPRELQKWAGNVDMLVQHMRDFADTGKKMKMEPGIIRSVLEGITSDEGMINSIMKGGVSPKKLAETKSYLVSDSEIGSINKGAAAWVKMHLAIEKAMADFNAIDGQKMANELIPLVKQILHLCLNLEKLAEDLKLFKIFGSTIDNLIVLTGGGAKITQKRMIDMNKAQKAAGTKDVIGDFLSSGALHQLMSHPILALKHEAKSVTNYMNTTIHTATKDAQGLAGIVVRGVERVVGHPSQQSSTLAGNN